MSLYKYLRDGWKKPKATNPQLWRERLITWRREPVTVKIERPTRLDKARSLGYKAKQGYVLVRQRVIRGGHTRPRPNKGRRSKHSSTRMNLNKNYRQICEERVARKYTNLVVLNSYEVAKDGKFFWYEVILVDPEHPVIKADKKINWITAKRNRSRVFQGKTSAGKKSRGMNK